MELRTLAEQVLFGKTLEEKLSFPREAITDDAPGVALKTPKVLARPQGLELNEKGANIPHPRKNVLSDDKNRGLLLHYFCNHELLATELMALVLLKFPDAPSSFRLGILETLKEEQIHTQMYLSRMKQCGITFGEIPVNGYFWKTISVMNDPLDYVTRLSLTFEQANLDYSREYASIFQQIGDTQTATILDKIYRDEINHVGFGLKWFRHWKAANKSDWDAFKEKLPFPLSPRRAKGDIFNVEGRKAAGLEDEFIQELSLFTQSKGRSPAIYFFNPSAESHVANNDSTGHQDGNMERAIQNDLAPLMLLLTKVDDIVLLNKKPTADHLFSLKKAGFPIPEIVTTDLRNNTSLEKTLDRKISALRPWGWSPDSQAYFEPLFKKLTVNNHLEHKWNANVRNLYSKQWSAQWLKNILEDQAQHPWLAPVNTCGSPAHSMHEVEQQIKYLRGLDYPSIALKAPFGVAGRNQMHLNPNESLSKEKAKWVDSVITQQGCIIIEPWLERILDFSVQLEQKGKTLKILGMNRMLIDKRGQFRGILCNGLNKGLSQELLCFIHGNGHDTPNIKRYYHNELKPTLEAHLNSIQFEGPLGIDAFIYKDPQGVLKLKPVVEINPRFTMGRIALDVHKHALPGLCGCFELMSKKQVKAQGFGTFSDFATAMQQQDPIVMDTALSNKIQSGTLFLNDPSQAEHFLARFQISKHFPEGYA